MTAAFESPAPQFIFLALEYRRFGEGVWHLMGVGPQSDVDYLDFLLHPRTWLRQDQDCRGRVNPATT